MDHEAEVAWAAGLFEGEGSIGVVNVRPRADYHGGFRGAMQLRMTDEDVVRQFAKVVGTKTKVFLVPSYEHKDGHSRQRVWGWSTHSQADIERIVEMFRPWLGHRRTGQADKTIAALRTRPSNTWKRRS